MELYGSGGMRVSQRVYDCVKIEQGITRTREELAGSR